MSSRKSSRVIWRPLAGALFLALPALALVPGCGGGGGSNGTTVYRLLGVEFLNGTNVVSRGNVSVTYNTSTFSSQSVAGYLQVVGAGATATGTPGATTTGTAAATTTATAVGTATPGSTALAFKTRALPGNYIPAAGTYQFVGTATRSSTGAPILNVNGAFVPTRPFNVTGTFEPGQNLTLTGSINANDGVGIGGNGSTQTGTLSLRVLDAPIKTGTTATPGATTTGTALPTTTGTPLATTTGTPFATTTPTTLGTSTPTPLFTFSPTSTVVPTSTFVPTSTPFPTGTPFGV